MCFLKIIKSRTFHRSFPVQWLLNSNVMTLSSPTYFSSRCRAIDKHFLALLLFTTLLSTNLTFHLKHFAESALLTRSRKDWAIAEWCVCWAQVLTCYRRKLCTILCIIMLWHTLRKIWYVPAQWSYVTFYQLNVIITVGARRLPMTYDTHPYNPSNPI